MNYNASLSSPWCLRSPCTMAKWQGGSRGVTGHDPDPKVQCPGATKKPLLFFLYFFFSFLGPKILFSSTPKYRSLAR